MLKYGNFTKLVCASIAICCVFTAAGQEKATEVRIADRETLSESKSELGADKTMWWPDSMIIYNYLGEPIHRIYYDKDSNGYSFGDMDVRFFEHDDYFSLQFMYIFSANSVSYSKQLYSCDTTYDDKNNLILVEFTRKGGAVAHTYRMEYNEENQLVLTEYYFYDRISSKYLYEYNKNGDPEYCKWYDYNRESDLMEMNIVWCVKYDEQDRPVEGCDLWLNYLGENSTYRTFYYSDGTYSPDIEVGNNTSVNSNNQGSFDLNVNVPADSISAGSITVTLPEDFTLDEENTSLAVDFAGLFDLTITKQDYKTWLLEIKPKTSRSASLRADEIQKAIQVAYRVDEEAKRGSYDISVNTILFTTPGGNIIPEPAIIVPAVLNRWGVANEAIEGNNVWVSGRMLYVRTNESCPVSVYAVGGQVIIQQTVSAGETALPLPQGIYFVKAGETSKKVMVR